MIRNIRYLIDLKDKETKAYGKKLLAEIKNLFKIIHNRDKVSPDVFTRLLEDAKLKITTTAIEDAPSKLNKKGKEEKNEAQNMANRFRDYGKAYFEFITQYLYDFRGDTNP